MLIGLIFLYYSKFCKPSILISSIIFMFFSSLASIEKFLIFESVISIFFGVKKSSNCKVKNFFCVLFMTLNFNLFFELTNCSSLLLYSNEI